jgi:anion-transporting  ArsA/GET3 family ATPase
MISQRFIIVAGKGGVGRSTLSAALALCFARKGLRTLLATSDAHEKTLSRLFGRKIDGCNTMVFKNLWAVNIQPMESIKEYALMILKLRYLQHLLTGTRAMQSFIANIPGIAEWAIMGKITWHLIEKASGAYVYDRIVLDAPPTGHSLSLIKIPLYITNVIRSGPLHAVAMERLGLLTDPSTTGIMIVVVPEELIVSEALEMVENLRAEIGTPVLGVMVNRTLSPLFSKEDEALIRQAADSGATGRRLRAACFRIMRTGLQQRQIDRLQGKLPLIILPEMSTRRMDFKDLTILADALENKIFT